MAMISLVSKYNFYQQIRLILRKFRDSKTPDATLLDEKLRITSALSLDAPHGEVESVYQDDPDSPVQVTAWHNGLTGAMGALPTVYSEWMIERHYRYSDSSAKAFIDIFGHRLYCLDYLAWQKNHLCALSESIVSPQIQTVILALTGLLSSSLSPALSQHASLFASPVRSMVNLERWLSQRFAIPAQIVPFTGGWRDVNKEECCQLGNPTKMLSIAPMLGCSRLEVHSHFDVLLGPMKPEISLRFIPNGCDWEHIWSCILDYVGPVLDFSVSLIISSAGLTHRPLGLSALGLDLCLGHNTSLPLHQVRLPAPHFKKDDLYAAS
jgi:type VI secretion system protein ImpH